MYKLIISNIKTLCMSLLLAIPTLQTALAQNVPFTVPSPNVLYFGPGVVQFVDKIRFANGTSTTLKVTLTSYFANSVARGFFASGSTTATLTGLPFTIPAGGTFTFDGASNQVFMPDWRGAYKLYVTDLANSPGCALYQLSNTVQLTNSSFNGIQCSATSTSGSANTITFVFQ
jgi:hypothetical protein